MKLVSVIIPTHRGSGYIVDALESVLRQTYKNIEVIIVDDNGCGSEEQRKTEQVVQPYIKSNQVKYIVHEVNKNGSAARNTGVRNSKGDYICLLDDDDIYYPDKIEKQVEALSVLDNEWGMVFCSTNGTKKGKSGDILYDLLIHSVVIGSNSFMVKREIWNELDGFDESFRRHQDYEFTARVASICKIKYLPFVGFTGKETNRNNPKNIQQAQQYRIHYLNKMMPLIKKFPKFKQKMIICCNAMEVTSKGSLFKISELINFARQWKPKFGLPIIIMVSLFKCVRKIKWKLIKVKR